MGLADGSSTEPGGGCAPSGSEVDRSYGMGVYSVRTLALLINCVELLGVYGAIRLVGARLINWTSGVLRVRLVYTNCRWLRAGRVSDRVTKRCRGAQWVGVPQAQETAGEIKPTRALSLDWQHKPRFLRSAHRLFQPVPPAIVAPSPVYLTQSEGGNPILSIVELCIALDGATSWPLRDASQYRDRRPTGRTTISTGDKLTLRQDLGDPLHARSVPPPKPVREQCLPPFRTRHLHRT